MEVSWPEEKYKYSDVRRGEGAEAPLNYLILFLYILTHDLIYSILNRVFA